MSILFMEGFDQYANGTLPTSEHQGRYYACGGSIHTNVRSSTTGKAASGDFYRAIPDRSEVIVGGFWKPDGMYGSGNAIITMFRNQGTIGSEKHGSLIVFQDGSVCYRNQGANSDVCRSAADAFIRNAWNHFELCIRVDGTAGSVEIRVNQKTVATATNVSTGAGVIRGVALYSAGTGFDDVVILDKTGADNNDFLGPCSVKPLYPNSDASVQFTRSTDTANYAGVDDNLGGASSDGDSTFNESFTPGHRDLFGVTAVPGGYQTVLAVQHTFNARRSDDQMRQVRGVLRSGTADSLTSVLDLDLAYRRLTTCFDKDPNGGLPWTESTASAVQIGYEVV